MVEEAHTPDTSIVMVLRMRCESEVRPNSGDCEASNGMRPRGVTALGYH